MQIGNLIPDLHKNATFSGLLQFAPGPAFFQNAVSQADGGGAGVALAPHLAAERTNLLVILHAPCPLADAIKVGCYQCFSPPCAFGQFFKLAALDEALAFRHGAGVFEFLLFHLGNFIQRSILQLVYRAGRSASAGQNRECGSGLFRFLPSG